MVYLFFSYMAANVSANIVELESDLKKKNQGPCDYWGDFW